MRVIPTRGGGRTRGEYRATPLATPPPSSLSRVGPADPSTQHRLSDGTTHASPPPLSPPSLSPPPLLPPPLSPPPLSPPPPLVAAASRRRLLLSPPPRSPPPRPPPPHRASSSPQRQPRRPRRRPRRRRRFRRGRRRARHRRCGCGRWRSRSARAAAAWAGSSSRRVEMTCCVRISSLNHNDVTAMLGLIAEARRRHRRRIGAAAVVVNMSRSVDERRAARRARKFESGVSRSGARTTGERRAFPGGTGPFCRSCWW